MAATSATEKIKKDKKDAPARGRHPRSAHWLDELMAH
jgi:hypothetical protein